AAPLAVVGGDDVSRIGARLASGGEIGGVAVVPRRELVEERRAVVVAGAGGLGAGLEALTLVAPGGPRTAPLDGAGGGDDAGAVLRQAGDLADETLAGALVGAVGEADHAAGVGRLVAAAAPDLDAIGIRRLLGPAGGPAGHRQLGLAVFMATAAVVAEVGAGVVGQRQTWQHGGGGGDGTPDDELPFDLPHAPSFVREPCAVRSGVQTGLPGLPESTVSSRFLFAGAADAAENGLRNGGQGAPQPGARKGPDAPGGPARQGLRRSGGGLGGAARLGPAAPAAPGRAAIRLAPRRRNP